MCVCVCVCVCVCINILFTSTKQILLNINCVLNVATAFYDNSYDHQQVAYCYGES
jgi:hypothetical protein